MGNCGWCAYCGSHFLQEGSCDLPEAVLTPEASPAGDIAGVVVRHHGVLLWQACQLDGVAQLHRFRQLNEGNVISGIQSGGLSEKDALATQPRLRSPGRELRARPTATKSPP